MTKLLQKLKALFAKGFATASEKEEIRTLFKELDTDGQEVVKEDVAEAEKLPEQEAGASDEDIQKGVRELIKSSGASAVAELKKLGEDIKADVETWLKEQAELREKKAGIYHPEVQEKRKKLNSYLRDYVNATLNDDVETISKINGGMSRKELTTDSTGSPFGGYVTDRELSAEIRYLIAEYGAARREFTTLQLSKNRYDANTLTTDVTVYWVDEGAAIKSTQVVIGQSELTLKKLAAIATLTRELLEDEEIDLFSFIGQRVAAGFAKAEDQAFFIGDGSGTYGSFTGIVNNTSTNTVTMASTKTAFSDVTADNLLDMQDKTPTPALENAKYYMHRTILSYIRKLKATTGEYIYQNPGQGQPATIWNKPVVLVEAMPDSTLSGVSKVFVLFGDLKQSSILGYKGAISADRFNAGVVRNVADSGDINLITTDREAIRWVERVGCIHLMPTAVTRLKTAAS
jgi:HK97 family phage major capsid protein